MDIQAPKLHSHVEDGLPKKHPLAFVDIYCSCGAMLHSENNECMQTWIETGEGNYCVGCFAEIPFVSALSNKYGICK